MVPFITEIFFKENVIFFVQWKFTDQLCLEMIHEEK